MTTARTLVKSYRNLTTFLAGFIVVTAAYLAFLQSGYFQEFREWAEGKEVVLFTLLIVIKIAGIIWPPLPGGVLTLGAIPVIGWELAYLSDFIGTTIGCSLAFGISRNYGKRFLRMIFTDEVLSQVEQLRFRHKRQFEMFLVLMLAGNTVVDIIAYAAGLIKSVRFSNFFAARVISHWLIGIPSFILIGNIFAGKNVFLSVALILVLIPVVWRLRYRYIEL